MQKDSLNQPLDDNTAFIGATAVWPQLGGSAKAGSNVIVGVLDTGVWPENPMLSPTGESAPAGGLKGCQFGDGTDTAHLGPAFACNNKLIGAYAFTQTYMAVVGSNGQEFCNNTSGVCSPRDPEGHGTHTTTTAGGDCVASAVLYGVDRGPVCGVAPGAHVIEYRVCLSQGCFSSDSVAAVQQAIADGANVINFSISGGGQPYTDAVELAFLDATNAGISVSASAGNSGPGAATSDHGGPWVTTVGASTGPRAFASTLHLTADGGASLNLPGITLTNGITSPTPVVMAASLPGEDALCQSTLAAGTATGKIVLCERGVNARIDKGFNVFSGGAAGMILYNNSAAVTDLESDNHYLPAIQTQFNSNSIANFVNGHTNVMATWAQGTSQPSPSDVMASFSSRGPLGDWIKPDVAAPGVQVLAGTTPQPDQTTADNGPPGNFFMAIAGTSMSSPHSAGVSALVKAAHPDWSPAEIKSALMTSSVQSVVKEDGVTPADPFDDGAGSIRADRAVNPTLVFNETYADFVAAGTDALHRVDLNIPSVDATTFTGDLTTHRTAINVSGASQNMAVSISEPAGVDITVGNNNHDLHIAAGASLTFPIEISAPDIANGQYEGRIDLVPAKGGNTVTIPVAFVKKQGSVTLYEHLLAAEHRPEDGRLALLRDSPEPGQRRGEREPLGHPAGEGQAAPVQERRRTGLGHRLRRRRPVERPAQPGCQHRRFCRRTTSPGTVQPAGICRSPSSEGTSRSRAPTTASRTSTCRRSSSAARPTARSIVVRNGLHRDRRRVVERRELLPADVPERGEAEQRHRPVLDRSEHDGRRLLSGVLERDPRQHPQRRCRRQLDRRRLRVGQELQQHDHSHRRDLDPVRRW